jgi:hypothetical protein
MTIENEELDEQSLFDQATDESDTPIAEVIPEVKEKDEPEPELVAEEKPDAIDPDARIPQWRREEIAAEKNRAVDEAKQAREQLATERSQREELQRRLAALEKPASKVEEEPDPLLDPKGYREHMEKRFEERLLNDRRENSLAFAHKTYGKDFEEAYAAAQKHIDPALKARMQQSRDPGETLIQWHREEKAKAEVGTDLTAYKQRLRDEALKDPEFRKAAMEAWRAEAPTQTNGRPNIQLAPSMSGVSRASAAVRAGNDDVSDSELFEQTTG